MFGFDAAANRTLLLGSAARRINSPGVGVGVGRHRGARHMGAVPAQNVQNPSQWSQDPCAAVAATRMRGSGSCASVTGSAVAARTTGSGSERRRSFNTPPHRACPAAAARTALSALNVAAVIAAVQRFRVKRSQAGRRDIRGGASWRGARHPRETTHPFSCQHRFTAHSPTIACVSEPLSLGQPRTSHAVGALFRGFVAAQHYLGKKAGI